MSEHVRPVFEQVEQPREVHLILPLNEETQRIIENPKRFWITSMIGNSFGTAKFRVEVREREG